jgi:hypothetical protein
MRMGKRSNYKEAAIKEKATLKVAFSLSVI